MQKKDKIIKMLNISGHSYLSAGRRMKFVVSDRRKGQVMILTVVILGGVIISTASLISYLVINNLKQSTDISLSARAIFAADAGKEWEKWIALKRGILPNASDCPSFRNGAQFTAGIAYYDNVSTSTLSVISAGQMGKNIRVWSWVGGITSSTPESGYQPAPDYIKTTCK